MAELWEKIKKGVIEGAYFAKEKSEELRKLGKRLDILQIKRNITKNFSVLGALVYQETYKVKNDKIPGNMKCTTTRRDFIKKTCKLGLAASTLPSFKVFSKNTEKPNILWLISEDTSLEIDCYGNTTVATPNIDRIAAEGVRFCNAFCTGPICSPSRSAFSTGMYQTTIGAHQHRNIPPVPLMQPVRLITEYFRDAGYFISNCSSIHYDQPGKMDWNFIPNIDTPFDGTDWRNRKTGQPFFAQVNFNLTHRPFERDIARPIDPANIVLPPYYPDHPVARRDWADYLESVQVLDCRIGMILERLEKDGLLDTTIIFYFSDHGRPFPRDKQFLYEGGIHVPLIIRWPGHLEAGLIEDGLVSLIDIGPTAMALTGFELPDYLHGHPLLGPHALAREYIIAARDRSDMAVDRIRCVRTRRYKYIRNFHSELPYNQPSRYKHFFYPMQNVLSVLHNRGQLTLEQERFMSPVKPREELYDLLNDPYELNNCAEDPRYNSVFEELRKTLATWIDETGDQGDRPEDSQVLKNQENERIIRYEKLWKERGISPDIDPESYMKFWEKELGIVQ